MKRGWLLLPLVLAGGLLLGTELQGSGQLYLEVTRAGDLEVLLALPLEPGEPVTLTYNHSVTGLPIWEVHQADRHGTLFVETERFVALGAGMGNWPGRGVHHHDGRLQEITDLHTAVAGPGAGGRPLRLRVGSREVDHAVHWRGRRFPLTPLAGGQAVLVQVQRGEAPQAP